MSSDCLNIELLCRSHTCGCAPGCVCGSTNQMVVFFFYVSASQMNPPKGKDDVRGNVLRGRLICERRKLPEEGPQFYRSFYFCLPKSFPALLADRSPTAV